MTTFSSRPAPSPAFGGSKEKLPAPTILDKEAIQSLPRQYIITQLRDNGYPELAESIPGVPNPDDQVHETLKEIATQLNHEREEQFRDMLNTLAPQESNLRQTCDTISEEMFKGKTHWGKVVTYIVFTSHLALYCAEREELKSKVSEIVQWSEEVMKDRVHDWIQEQGGWQAILEHFDIENWRISLSTTVMSLGAAVMVGSGLVAALKQFFSF